MMRGKIAKQSSTTTAGSTIIGPECRSIRSARLGRSVSSAGAAVAVIRNPPRGPARRTAPGGRALLRADRGLVEGQLVVGADLLVELVPAVGDRLHHRVLVD